MKVVNLSTYSTRTSNIADTEIIFAPSSDLVIWNYIAHEIVYNHPEVIDWDYVNNHCAFTTGPVDIGYGLRNNPSHPNYNSEKDVMEIELKKTISESEGVTLGYLGHKAGDVMENKNAASAGKHWLITFEEFKEALKPYTLDISAPLIKGDPDEDRH